MRMPLLLPLLLALAASPPPAAGQDAEVPVDKAADIERLLEVTGALRIGKQFGDMAVTQTFAQLRQLRPDIPEDMVQVVDEVVREVIDEKYFSHAEIRELLAFYETEVGRKAIRVLPALVGESMQVGQEWGRSLGPEIERRIIERFEAAGYDLRA